MKTFKLENEPKIKTEFRVPENYFEDFSAKMTSQLPEKEPKIISLFTKRKIWMYAAAAVMILGLTIPVYNHLVNDSLKIDDATLENYISYHSTISDEELVNLLDEKDIQKMSIDLNIEDKTIENELTADNNLEQYILN
jgi:hypothetical protein